MLWLLLITACIPFPHRQQRSPAIHGAAYRDAAPLAGVPVTLQANPSLAVQGCPDPDAVAVTDPEGRFALPATDVKLWFMVMGDRRDTWRVCFDLPEGGEVVWEDSGWWGGPADAQALTCELDLPAEPPVCAARDH